MGEKNIYNPFDEWVALGCPPPKEDHLRAGMHAEGRFDDVLCQLRYIQDVDEIIVLHSFDLQKRDIEVQTGVNKIAKELNIKINPITKENRSTNSDKTVKWKRETVDYLQTRYKEEIERFNFKPPLIE